MTATNINIDEFIHILTTLKADGTSLINLDMIPDSDHPSMNKLVIHPVTDNRMGEVKREAPSITIRNPKISTDNDDIFNQFNL